MPIGGLRRASAHALRSCDCSGFSRSRTQPMGRPAELWTGSLPPELAGFIGQHLQTRVVLCGHSMGGHVAQLLADDRPDLLEALIAIDSPPNGPPLTTRLKWRWKRRKQGGPRPEFNSAQDLVKRFRLSPPGHALTPAKIENLALQGSEQLPNGNWAFRFDPETRVPRTTMRGMRRPRLRRLVCRCWSCAEPRVH